MLSPVRRSNTLPQVRTLFSSKLSSSLFKSLVIAFSFMILISRSSRGFVSSPTIARSGWYKSEIRSKTANKRQIFANFATKKRIVFLGTPEVAAETLMTLHEASLQPESTFEIATVITQPPKRGKRRKLESSPVQRTAEELKIPFMTPAKANEKQFLDQLQHDIVPDLCITAAYGQYLPKRFLQTPKYGTVNIHPSLLPKWRGASPVQRSLENGDNPVGVTVLYTVSQMDAGPIIAQEEYECNDAENATILLPKLFRMGTKLLMDGLPDIFNHVITFDTATPQDESQATAAALIHSSEAQVRPWQDSARTILNKIRAFSMWPQTFCYFQVNDREPVKVKLLEARVLEEQVSPTDVVSLGSNAKTSGLRLVCFDGSVLEIMKLCPATRKPCPARDFQNGYPGETIRWVQPPGEETASDALTTATTTNPVESSVSSTAPQ